MPWCMCILFQCWCSEITALTVTAFSSTLCTSSIFHHYSTSGMEQLCILYTSENSIRIKSLTQSKSEGVCTGREASAFYSKNFLAKDWMKKLWIPCSLNMTKRLHAARLRKREDIIRRKNSCSISRAKDFRGILYGTYAGNKDRSYVEVVILNLSFGKLRMVSWPNPFQDLLFFRNRFSMCKSCEKNDCRHSCIRHHARLYLQ